MQRKLITPDNLCHASSCRLKSCSGCDRVKGLTYLAVALFLSANLLVVGDMVWQARHDHAGESCAPCGPWAELIEGRQRHGH